MLFLLFQEHCNVDKEKEKFENWLETHGQSILPYIIVCGSVETVFETYLVLKSEKYSFSNPLKAVEACFMCLTALRKWPYMCDYVWGFIQKMVYEFDANKSYAAVTKLVVQMHKTE